MRILLDVGKVDDVDCFTVDVVDDHGGVLTCSSQTPRFYQFKAARGCERPGRPTPVW